MYEVVTDFEFHVFAGFDDDIRQWIVYLCMIDMCLMIMEMEKLNFNHG